MSGKSDTTKLGAELRNLKDSLPPSTSQFVGGLVMGLVLGTAGYYFFGTSEGKKHRAVLVKRWQTLAAEVTDAAATKSTPKSTKSSLSEFLRTGLRKFAAELGANDWKPSEGLTTTKFRSTQTSSVLAPQRKSKTLRAK
ncbi:MAG TPA: hypothetical protein DEP87_01430, partial [Candidatus Pacebacteria bacterium]|nr:hypothetical protein [Candidatus Paceibacterota bacterium]